MKTSTFIRCIACMIMIPTLVVIASPQVEAVSTPQYANNSWQKKIQNRVKFLRSQYPGAEIGVQVGVSDGDESTSDYQLVVNVGNVQNLTYYASMAKVPYMITTLRWMQRHNHNLDEKFITYDLSNAILGDVYTKVVLYKPVDAFVERIVLPRLDPMKIERAKASIKDMDIQDTETMKLFFESLKKDVTSVEPLSMREIISLTLGPSSNHSLVIIRDFLNKQNDVKVLADRVVEDMDVLLKNELRKDLTLSAFTGSTKSKEVGYWNSGSLEEINAIFKMLANDDPRLYLPEVNYGKFSSQKILLDGFKLMRESMREIADENVEFKSVMQTRRFVRDAYGKYGIYPNMPSTWQTKIIEEKGWEGSPYFSHVSSIERITLKDGSVIDIAYTIDVPHEKEKSTAKMMYPMTKELRGYIARLINREISNNYQQ